MSSIILHLQFRRTTLNDFVTLALNKLFNLAIKLCTSVACFHNQAEGCEVFFDAHTIVCTVLSAIEAELSRSSMVAINVDSFSVHLILVMTLCCLWVVATVKPRGVLKLSGEIASATAFAKTKSS
jgi:hypothetical protein